MPLYLKNGTSSIIQSGGSVAAGSSCCCPLSSQCPDYDMDMTATGVTQVGCAGSPGECNAGENGLFTATPGTGVGCTNCPNTVDYPNPSVPSDGTLCCKWFYIDSVTHGCVGARWQRYLCVTVYKGTDGNYWVVAHGPHYHGEYNLGPTLTSLSVISGLSLTVYATGGNPACNFAAVTMTLTAVHH